MACAGLRACHAQQPKLIQHWADPARENRVLFCQREAAETAVFLAEVAGRHGYTDWRVPLGEPNDEHNAGLPRVALKMATGTGKTGEWNGQRTRWLYVRYLDDFPAFPLSNSWTDIGGIQSRADPKSTSFKLPHERPNAAC